MKGLSHRRMGVVLVSVLALGAIAAGLTWLIGYPGAAELVPALSADNASLAEPDQNAAGGEADACRPCRNRPWCGCYYQYGDFNIPRISCDPCCYWSHQVPYPICLD